MHLYTMLFSKPTKRKVSGQQCPSACLGDRKGKRVGRRQDSSTGFLINPTRGLRETNPKKEPSLAMERHVIFEPVCGMLAQADINQSPGRAILSPYFKCEFVWSSPQEAAKFLIENPWPDHLADFIYHTAVSAGDAGRDELRVVADIVDHTRQLDIDIILSKTNRQSCSLDVRT